jgi:hypothetical protein
MRVAATGLGVLLCTGLVGCMNSDKPKDIKKSPTGLPGTPTLPPGNAGAMNNGVSRTGVNGTNQPYAGPGANLQAGAYNSPAAGLGGGQQRYGTTGQNTLRNTGGVQPAGYTNYAPGAPGAINSPAMPGVMPAGGPAPFAPLGAAPTTPNDRSVAALTPPPPSLPLNDAGPVPPLPPSGLDGRPQPFNVQPPTAAAPPLYNNGTAFRQ